jgi:uncharacterized protein YecE (DUF72 family)
LSDSVPDGIAYDGGMDNLNDQTKVAAGLYIGCAGWSLPGNIPQQSTTRLAQSLNGLLTAEKDRKESQLQRYAKIFHSVEINTSFYRNHLPATYVRWRESVPQEFRFSVKIPRTITHQLRLQNCRAEVERFCSEVQGLQEKLACLLVQLPPSLRYETNVVKDFFTMLGATIDVPIICEPRHPGWFTTAAVDTLLALDIAYVDADPKICDLPADTLESGAIVYHRLHGSPEMYYSAYAEAFLLHMANEIAHEMECGKQVWCIFDNTANGEAFLNAQSLTALMSN